MSIKPDVRTTTVSQLVYSCTPVLWLSCIVIMIGCGSHGVQGFSRDSAWATIVTDDGLFTVSRSGAEVHFLASDINRHYPPSFADNGQLVVFVTESGQVMAIPTVGGNGITITSEVASLDLGILIALPSDMILFSNERDKGDRFMQVIDPVTTEIIWQLEGIGEVFFTHGALRARKSGADQVWHISPAAYEETKLVLQMEDYPENLVLCLVGSNGLDCDFERPLGRTLSKADMDIIEARVSSDPHSGILTPNGHQLIVRTQSWIGREREFAYSMWALDLDSDVPPVLLVDGVSYIPEYSMAPFMSLVAYEASGDFLNVYDFETGMARTVATNAQDPDWR